MKKYIVLISITILLIVFGISFIEYDNSSTANVVLQDGITYGVERIPEGLKDISGLSSADEDILCALTKGLVEKNSDGEIIPSLASEFNRSDDGIEYEFKIRDNIYWSNGSKVTAKDVVTFFKELLKECSDDDIECLMQIYGAESFRDGKVSFDKGVAINYKDDCVTIRLNRKYDSFLDELSKPQYRVRSNIILWDDIIKNYENIDYCGDYKVKAADKNHIVLEKNCDKVNFNYITVIRDESVEQSMAAYEVNQRDIVINPPESELNKLKDENRLITIPENYGSYIVINNSAIPMQGRRMIYNLIYTAVGEYQSTNPQEFDLAEGCYFRDEKDNLTMIQQRKVNSAQKSEWTEPKVLTLIAENNKQNKNLCRIIKNWFSENTNITLKYTLADEEDFNDQELKQRYDIIVVNNNAVPSEREEFYSGFEEYYSDMDMNILEGLRINDYYGDYHKLEDSLFLNYNILPLVFYKENIAVSNKVSVIDFDGNCNIDFSKLN